MKAKDLTHKHIGQRFKLENPYPPGGTFHGGLSDFEHLDNPRQNSLSTVIWIRGKQLKLHPDTPLMFITKGTTA